jgi:hypothetical protein
MDGHRLMKMRASQTSEQRYNMQRSSLHLSFYRLFCLLLPKPFSLPRCFSVPVKCGLANNSSQCKRDHLTFFSLIPVRPKIALNMIYNAFQYLLDDQLVFWAYIIGVKVADRTDIRSSNMISDNTVNPVTSKTVSHFLKCSTIEKTRWHLQHQGDGFELSGSDITAFLRTIMDHDGGSRNQRERTSSSSGDSPPLPSSRKRAAGEAYDHLGNDERKEASIEEEADSEETERRLLQSRNRMMMMMAQPQSSAEQMEQLLLQRGDPRHHHQQLLGQQFESSHYDRLRSLQERLLALDADADAAVATQQRDRTIAAATTTTNPGLFDMGQYLAMTTARSSGGGHEAGSAAAAAASLFYQQPQHDLLPYPPSSSSTTTTTLTTAAAASREQQQLMTEMDQQRAVAMIAGGTSRRDSVTGDGGRSTGGGDGSGLAPFHPSSLGGDYYPHDGGSSASARWLDNGAPQRSSSSYYSPAAGSRRTNPDPRRPAVEDYLDLLEQLRQQEQLNDRLLAEARVQQLRILQNRAPATSSEPTRRTRPGTSTRHREEQLNQEHLAQLQQQERLLRFQDQQRQEQQQQAASNHRAASSSSSQARSVATSPSNQASRSQQRPSKKQRKVVPPPSSSSSSLPTTAAETYQPGIPLALPTDLEKLTTYQTLIRASLEYFTATLEDINTTVQGRRQKLFVGQSTLRNIWWPRNLVWWLLLSCITTGFVCLCFVSHHLTRVHSSSFYFLSRHSLQVLCAFAARALVAGQGLVFLSQDPDQCLYV